MGNIVNNLIKITDDPFSYSILRLTFANKILSWQYKWILTIIILVKKE